MRRRLFMLAALMSAVLCVGMCVLWVRSYRITNEFSSLRRADRCRYRVESRHGRVSLLAPPPVPASPDVAAAVDATVAGLRNDQILWLYSVDWESGGLQVEAPIAVRLSPGTPASLLVTSGYQLPDIARPLLAAMEDPDRFAVAHVILSLVASGKAVGDCQVVRRTVPGEPHPQIGLLGAYDGLSAYVAPIAADLRMQDDWMFADKKVEDDTQLLPGQLPTIRAAWHRRLDVPIVEAAYWQMFVATLLLPGWYCSVGVVGRLRVRTRRLHRLCSSCGYDLRATPGRCPECGTVPDQTVCPPNGHGISN